MPQHQIGVSPFFTPHNSVFSSWCSPNPCDQYPVLSIYCIYYFLYFFIHIYTHSYICIIHSYIPFQNVCFKFNNISALKLISAITFVKFIHDDVCILGSLLMLHFVLHFMKGKQFNYSISYWYLLVEYFMFSKPWIFLSPCVQEFICSHYNIVFIAKLLSIPIPLYIFIKTVFLDDSFLWISWFFFSYYCAETLSFYSSLSFQVHLHSKHLHSVSLWSTRKVCLMSGVINMSPF